MTDDNQDVGSNKSFENKSNNINDPHLFNIQSDMTELLPSDDYSHLFTDTQNLSPRKQTLKHSNLKSQATSLLCKKPNFPSSKIKSNRKQQNPSILQPTTKTNSPTEQPNVSDDNNMQNNIMTSATSSMFNILACLTQQNSINQLANINSNCQTTNLLSKSLQSHGVNSSLQSLLNENVAGSLQVKDSLCESKTHSPPDLNLQNLNRNKSSAQSDIASMNSTTSSGEQPNHSFNILADSQPLNAPVTLESFILSIVQKTNVNIGPAGISEAIKILEKFTTSLFQSSQTIADHYVAPNSFYKIDSLSKPEINPSDIILAYKMLQRTL